MPPQFKYPQNYINISLQHFEMNNIKIICELNT